MRSEDVGGTPRGAPGAIELSRAYEVAIVGGGIVGLATALALKQRGHGSVVVLEAESEPATHQTGHNSGVIHSGLYYKPGSLKAENCARGREAMYAFCRKHEVPHERCGKLVVATTEAEVTRLTELERRGRANGLDGIERLGASEMKEYEPRSRGLAALRVPSTGIVDFAVVARKMAELLLEDGVEILTHRRIEEVLRRPGSFVLRWEGGEIRAENVLGCAGLQADRLARECGLETDVRIVPFRGEYHQLVPERRGLVRNLIYPVPDPRFPFLGVHFTRTIDGNLEVGPNALVALSRSGYSRFSFSPRDAVETLTDRAFWRLASRYRRTATGELYRSFSKKALAEALQRMVPGVRPEDLVPAGAGIRAQAVSSDGSLLDDFHIVEAEGMLHVLNAPSPAATASLSIGHYLAERAEKSFGLGA